jgi:hypothetical protein
MAFRDCVLGPNSLFAGVSTQREQRSTMLDRATTPPKRAVLILAAWGDAYVDRMLHLCLPALLAPGNWPALASIFAGEVVIVTERKLFKRVQQAAVISQLEQLGLVRLLPVDDLLVGKDSYGLTLTMAFFRAIALYGSEMVDTCFLFLNTDFILADGSYQSLIPLISSGARVICAPSYCAIEENVLPILDRKRIEGSGRIVFQKREMASLILRNLHDTVRHQIITSNFHYSAVYSYQAYIQPDDNTLIGYQMPISVVALRPTAFVETIETFWDYGVTSSLCDGAREYILDDSDDFLMLELRKRRTGAEYLRPGRITPEYIADQLRDTLTLDQVHYGQYLLTLHSKEISKNRNVFVRSLRDFRARLLARLPDKLVEARAHPAWEYHMGLYRELTARNTSANLNAHNQEKRHMSINASWLRMFLEMRKRHGFMGSKALALGVQDVMFNHDTAEALFQERRIEYAHIPDSSRTYALSRNQRQFRKDAMYYMGVKDLFGMMEYETIETLDAFENDGPDLLWDLCKPIAKDWHNRYDLVFDIGVLEHTADIFQALENVANLVKVGGWMLLYLPMVSPINTCIYHPNPPFYFDILSANGFYNFDAWINWMPDWDQQNDIRTIWLNYKYNDDVYIWRPRYYTIMFFIAQKREHLAEFRPVLQNFYKDWFAGVELFSRAGLSDVSQFLRTKRMPFARNVLAMLEGRSDDDEEMNTQLWLHPTAWSSPTPEQIARFPLSELGVPHAPECTVVPVDSQRRHDIPEQMIVGSPPREQLYL